MCFLLLLLFPDVGLVVLLHAHPPAAGARAGAARPDRGLARRPLALHARRGEGGQPAEPLQHNKQEGEAICRTCGGSNWSHLVTGGNRLLFIVNAPVHSVWFIY